MYAASDAFHKAVKNGEPQMPLLIFKDAVFTERDIDVDTGIEFDDNFNLEENLSIGQATSNEIRFTLFNDDRLLNNYTFGEFTATLGVQISTQTYTQQAPLTLNTNNAQYLGYESYPFIRRDGTALSVQPSFAPKTMLGYDNKVYVFDENSHYAVYDDRTGANITGANPVNGFMRRKAAGWSGKTYFYNPNTRRLSISDAGTRTWFEFVPLGVFIAERPKVPDQIRISLVCHDRMTKFDQDMPKKSALGLSYPTTIGTLFTKMCSYAGVPYKTATFINSVADIKKEPDAFETATMRQVMMWIAEAAGSNARFDRDGKLIMDWLRTTTQKYDEGQYTEFQQAWYKTQKVDKLYKKSTYGGTDATVGTGNVGYLIQDNPLL